MVTLFKIKGLSRIVAIAKILAIMKVRNGTAENNYYWGRSVRFSVDPIKVK